MKKLSLFFLLSACCFLVGCTSNTREVSIVNQEYAKIAEVTNQHQAQKYEEYQQIIQEQYQGKENRFLAKNPHLEEDYRITHYAYVRSQNLFASKNETFGTVNATVNLQNQTIKYDQQLLPFEEKASEITLTKDPNLDLPDSVWPQLVKEAKVNKAKAIQHNWGLILHPGLLALGFYIIGILGIINPRSYWKLETKWRYDTPPNPSSFMLFLNQMRGWIGIILGLVFTYQIYKNWQ